MRLNKKQTKGETMISMTGGEEMKGRVTMERKEREEEGIETWKAECDGVTAVCVMKAVNARGKAELTREAVMLQVREKRKKDRRASRAERETETASSEYSDVSG